MYDQSGHGGQCLDCDGNTEGPHCEYCKFGHYRRENDVRCVDCQCNPIGAESSQCDPYGKCKCKPGVVGDKCDRCAPYHYELSIVGCKVCNCNSAGSYDSPPICDPRDGSCRCKAHIEGQNCDRPKPGFFNLDAEHFNGAMPCFCYGHSSICNSSMNHFIHNITVSGRSATKWQVVDSRQTKTDIVASSNGAGDLIVNVNNLNDDLWVLAPKEFLGNQLYSYNQDLSFILRILPQTQPNSAQLIARASRKDFIIESAQYNLEAYIPIYGSRFNNNENQLPNSDSQLFTFKLNQQSGWMPSLSTSDFQRLLTNVSAIKIRVSYAPQSRAVLSKLSLKSAKLYSKKTELDEIMLDANGVLLRRDLTTALFVEECKCPQGHIGQHCEQCAAGYRREPIEGGPYARCVPCNCNHHSLSCDQNTGKCDCMHHTSGDNCEKCEEGYYGNPIVVKNNYNEDQLSSASNSNGLLQLNEYEMSNMCKKCPCLNDGPCAEIFNFQLNRAEVVCLACPQGTQGNLCEMCDDGYYNPNPSQRLSIATCERCQCNGNIDENAIGNCDSKTGKCLKCIFNTTGDSCEHCMPDHWGNALTSLKCHSCDCSPHGTLLDQSTNRTRQCNLVDGQCECKPNVKNRQCDQCKNGYWNLQSGKGCEECKCNVLGSFNSSCDSQTGQCYCRPGVQGLKCDQCMPLYYGFSDEGCKSCECDTFGSLNLQCDDFGKCKCRENFSSAKCNKCDENFHNFTSGCIKCDDCYNLVQNKVNLLREKIRSVQIALNKLLRMNGGGSALSPNHQTIQLQNKLQALKNKIQEFHFDLYERQSLNSSYKDTISHFKIETRKLGEALKSTDAMFEQFNLVFKQAERLHSHVNSSIAQTRTQLNFMQRKTHEQEEKLNLIKQARSNHDQNIKLQSFAKQAREVAEAQEEQAQILSQRLREMVADAQRAVRDLHSLLLKYDDKKGTELSGSSSIEDFDVIRTSAENLIEEAKQQKISLEDNLKQVNKFIKRLNEFQMPDDKKLDSISQEVKNHLDTFQIKVKN